MTSRWVLAAPVVISNECLQADSSSHIAHSITIMTDGCVTSVISWSRDESQT